jgi:hypothetical protein
VQSNIWLTAWLYVLVNILIRVRLVMKRIKDQIFGKLKSKQNFLNTRYMMFIEVNGYNKKINKQEEK